MRWSGGKEPALSVKYIEPMSVAEARARPQPPISVVTEERMGAWKSGQVELDPPRGPARKHVPGLESLRPPTP